jgi:hypothetical protein
MQSGQELNNTKGIILRGGALYFSGKIAILLLLENSHTIA